MPDPFLYQAPDSDERQSAVLLAHGSGAPMDSEFMTSIADGLVARGFPVMRFEYPYMQKVRETGRRRPPDRAPALEEAHVLALRELAERVPGKRIISSGKSLGGRIASRIAAQGTDSGLTAALAFFGYPLHPAKRTDKLRSEHFAALAEPALFLQGTRDALCELPLLRRELERYGGRATLHVVEGGDHGFDVLVRSGRSKAEVVEELCDAFDHFERASFPSD